MIHRLSDLHEGFIEQARRPMNFGLPISAREPVPVIVPIDKWQKQQGGLVKKYRFRKGEDRIRFVTELMEYEEQVQHHAEIYINESNVSIKVITKGVDEVTSIDKEYANFCDALYKDICYSP